MQYSCFKCFHFNSFQTSASLLLFKSQFISYFSISIQSKNLPTTTIFPSPDSLTTQSHKIIKLLLRVSTETNKQTTKKHWPPSGFNCNHHYLSCSFIIYNIQNAVRRELLTIQNNGLCPGFFYVCCTTTVPLNVDAGDKMLLL